MNFFEALSLAAQGIYANRLRSSLTMLGILIGVGAVILLVAVGNGATAAVNARIQGLGSNLLIIVPGAVQSGGVQQGFATGASLSYQDYQALGDQSQAPDVVAAIALLNSRAQVTYQGANWNTSINGTTPEFPSVRAYSVSDGDFFTADDVTSQRRVAVIGPTVAQNLFAGVEPVGQQIKINRQTFTVVGVFDSKGSSAAAAGTNQDDLIAIPITAAWAYLFGGRNKNVSTIYVEAASSDTTAAQQEVSSILLAQHKISDPAQADFRVSTQQDIAATATQTTNILTLLLGAIAAISLVVGGIGIMNIMLVTVTERTREIGIRKAIGAKRRDILLQFLIESMFLSAVGGLLGILVGTVGANLLPRFVTSLPVPVVSGPSVVLAFGVSVGIGLFFGIYPANRAAVLHPIEALRYQ